MTSERTINLVIAGIVVFGLAALGISAYLSVHHVDSAGIQNMASVALGGLVGVLASTRSKAMVPEDPNPPNPPNPPGP